MGIFVLLLISILIGLFISLFSVCELDNMEHFLKYFIISTIITALCILGFILLLTKPNSIINNTKQEQVQYNGEPKNYIKYPEYDPIKYKGMEEMYNFLNREVFYDLPPFKEALEKFRDATAQDYTADYVYENRIFEVVFVSLYGYNHYYYVVTYMPKNSTNKFYRVIVYPYKNTYEDYNLNEYKIDNRFEHVKDIFDFIIKKENKNLIMKCIDQLGNE